VTPIDSDLVIENLSFSYPEFPGVPTRELLKSLDLELPAGKTALLLARPDQGKTTLCRILAGLVPRFSGGEISGTLSLGSLKLLERQPYELLEQIGLVFQHPGEQLISSRCDSEVAFALESLGIPRPEIENRLKRVLRLMNLERYRHRSPKILSGGEKKKLLIACLLAIGPLLWLLDETLEELDSGTKSRLLGLLGQRGGITLILSAKWHELFRRHVDRVFHLEEGKALSIQEPMGSPAFHDLLVERGYELPAERPSRHSAPGEPLLEAEDLFFRYPDSGEGSDEAFSLQIEELQIAVGETMALVGDNGSGKSTLGRILCGLLRPRKGTIRIRTGGKLRTAGEDDLNRFTGYLFQDPDLQIFLPTVFEELALGLKRLHLPEKEIRARVERAVSLFDLPATQAPPSLMSYGTRKKLQAGVYYLLDRPLMIIDEGDSGLSVNDFAEMVRIFQKSEGSLIFITHDRRLAEALADRVLQLRSGRLA
jgi:energy-coupling factor transport system ATP-binding protein